MLMFTRPTTCLEDTHMYILAKYVVQPKLKLPLFFLQGLSGLYFIVMLTNDIVET
ncbi:hypothetical protein RO3G_10442 [Rhizopus delemar RA 99-880]|uniref:Uncharacterized protein n=1 Tax=Rhizopus delemar (strain RA 99-880 / ATCC MYA-4621 / FGSC 9543 / NRRL 43880) TaxID=246409 RepID=I1CBA2_RHIO9|nr:hypothetical protein RO3G_10442 [Rhizopus delemar RA 99-880]|eukprot:EIE85732.1 hypothetical protein RO3G_10442 [Rhizopus delemar RA 99-880]